MKETKALTIGKRLALVIGVAWLAIGLLFGLGELFSTTEPLGQRVGGAISHLVVQMLPVLLVTWLAWKKPFLGGLCFLILTGAAIWLFKRPNEFIWATIFIPFPLTGMLLILGSLLPGRPATASD